MYLGWPITLDSINSMISFSNVSSQNENGKFDLIVIKLTLRN